MGLTLGPFSISVRPSHNHGAFSRSSMVMISLILGKYTVCRRVSETIPRVENVRSCVIIYPWFHRGCEYQQLKSIKHMTCQESRLGNIIGDASRLGKPGRVFSQSGPSASGPPQTSRRRSNHLFWSHSTHLQYIHHGELPTNPQPKSQPH